MVLKTIQWNIGGGKIRKPKDDFMDSFAYCNDALDVIINMLRKYDPDIITFQECHTNDSVCQSEVISKALGLKYFVNNIYDKSHLEEGQGLSQAIISRFPIEKQNFTFFINPNFTIVGPKGDMWLSHNKGVTSCFIQLPNQLLINVKTSHSTPFNSFGVDPLSESSLYLRQDMEKKLRPEHDPFLYQGDLNFNDFSVKAFLPGILTDNVQEIILNVPTTPKDKKYDHIIYRGMSCVGIKVITEVLTDHFPIYSEFELV